MPTVEQKAAYVNVRVARALIRMAACVAENKQREHLGQSMAWDEGTISSIIDEERLNDNDINEELFRGGD